MYGQCCAIMTCQLVFSKEDVLRRVTAMKHTVIDNSPHEHYTPKSAWWMLNATNKSRSILPTAITLSEQVGVPLVFFKKHFGGNRWQTHFVTHFPSCNAAYSNRYVSAHANHGNNARRTRAQDREQRTANRTENSGQRTGEQRNSETRGHEWYYSNMCRTR
jgi:hypothetical protein